MIARPIRQCLLLFACLTLALSGWASGAITPEHQKQIGELRKDLNKVQALITRKEYDEAAKLLSATEKRLDEIATDAGVDKDHKLISGLHKQIELKRGLLTRKTGGGEPAGDAGTFEKDVAPILVARCLNCHGADNPRADLRLDTFGGIVAGCGGRLVVPRNPNASVLVQRVTAAGDERMPKNRPPLTADELKKITAWIASGAKFGGDNSMPLAALVAAGAKASPAAVVINKPTGGERVSFVRDIAPFMVNICVRCHGGADPRSGFSLETFEKLMRGGQGGPVVIAGNTKDSRLWHLVGEQDPIKMPPGQLLITRNNWNNLRTWIEEGAKFDGSDARATLRSLVPTDEERRTRELAAMSPEELAERRQLRAHELWRSALSKEAPAEHSSSGFLMLGNASEPRLREIGGWAEEESGRLKKLFGVKEDQIWRGRLTVFVFRDRFSFAEFVQTVEKAELPAEVGGYVRVTAAGEDAYVALEDAGDSGDEDSPGTRAELMALLTEGLLRRSATQVPDWAAKGTGLALAARGDPKNPYLRNLGVAALEAVKALQDPEEVFESTSFTPGDLPQVGGALVQHMLKLGGEPQYVRFLNELLGGKSLADALRAVYSAEPSSLARSFVADLGSAKPAPKKGAKGKP